MNLDKSANEVPACIQAAYDPQLIRQAGLRMVELLAEHLTKAETGQAPVLPWADPATRIREARCHLHESPSESWDGASLAGHFAELVEVMLKYGLNLHSPHYVGHQVPASIPLAGLFDAIGSVTNQCMAIYEMGPWATAVEHAVVAELGQAIGWKPETFSGIVTHGGSLANTTALLTARNVAVPDSWENGLANRSEHPVLVVHSDAHYSVARSAGIIGIGSGHVVRVPLDCQRRMDPNHLDDCLSLLRSGNQPIIATVACACATPIGAFDPLDDIAEICARHDVWLHVDAAHGGAACLSRKHRHLVNGLQRADSVVWDAHKMLFMPALCALVFYRDKSHRFETFRQEAPYLFDPSAPGLADYDSGLRTIECTKRAAAFGLWGVWSMFGAGLFEELVDTTFALGQKLYDKLAEAPDFDPLHCPQCNIVVFRHLPLELQDASAEQIGRFQLELRRKTIESGEFYLVSTKIDGVGALRVTLINPLTTADDLDRLLESLRSHAREALAILR